MNKPKRRVTKKPDPSKRLQPTEVDRYVEEGGIDPEVQDPPFHQPAVVEPEPERVVKSKSSDHQKVTLYLTKNLHKRLKAHAALEDIEMSDAAEDAISKWLDIQVSKKLDS